MSRGAMGRGSYDPRDRVAPTYMRDLLKWGVHP